MGIENVINTLKQYAYARQDACNRGLESPELSALLVEKYAWGMKEAIQAVDQDADINSIISVADQLCASIDKQHKENRNLRYSRVAKLDLSIERSGCNMKRDSLSNKDHEQMDALIGAVLDDYKNGAVSKSAVVAGFAQMIAAIDDGNHDEAREWFSQGRKFIQKTLND